MSNRNRWIAGASALLVLVLFLILVWYWQPERQVRLHQRQLLSALEDRDWEDVADLMADSYSDRWRHDKEFVVREAREVFRQFITLQVSGEERDLSVENGAGEIKTRLTILGRGGPVAEFAMSRVNVMREPWIFRWQQQSAWPWDWQLVWVEQPELSLHVQELL